MTKTVIITNKFKELNKEINKRAHELRDMLDESPIDKLKIDKTLHHLDYLDEQLRIEAKKIGIM